MPDLHAAVRHVHARHRVHPGAGPRAGDAAAVGVSVRPAHAPRVDAGGEEEEAAQLRLAQRRDGDDGGGVGHRDGDAYLREAEERGQREGVGSRRKSVEGVSERGWPKKMATSSLRASAANTSAHPHEDHPVHVVVHEGAHGVAPPPDGAVPQEARGLHDGEVHAKPAV